MDDGESCSCSAEDKESSSSDCIIILGVNLGCYDVWFPICLVRVCLVRVWLVRDRGIRDRGIRVWLGSV